MPTPLTDPHESIVLDIIRKRYSCRRYRSDQVDTSRLAVMKEAVRQAPSACNRQPYTFHFVTDEKIIKEIAQAVPLGPASVNKWIETAPLIVAAVGKPELVWHKMTQVIDTDYHRTDAIIAMDHLSLVATEMDLGTCWVGWFHRKKVGKILKVNSGEEVVILMTVGFPESRPSSRKPRKELDELIVER
ncbi:nitroreductase family protein [bacterium]|nr:nitroreductase family protein [bacterium]